jgi:hypothetical protein
MPYPISIPVFTSKMARSPRSPSLWPAYPDIPIYLEAAEERRAIAKTYGTTPTTPTTPEVLSHSNKSTHLSPARAYAPQPSPIDPSPTTTIQTSSDRSSIWPIPEPPPEIQHHHAHRPTLRFFPTQRPRVRLDSIPTLQIPTIDEKTPINDTHPGLGIVNGLPKPPSIEVSSPVNEKSDLESNFAQRIEEKLWRYSASGNIFKRWLMEVLSWLFSALCMGAVIGVLIYLKDDSLSKWALAEKTGLTLNAYISILSKMAGAAMILPVSEALGQLKWSWFLEHSKQMWDFEIFDNASRGPWGAMLLLIRTKGRALAALGAVIMLCSLALDPFFQQVVDFPDRWALQNTSSRIPRVASYQPFYTPELFQGYETNFADPNMRPVVSQFFIDNGTEPVQFGNGTRPDIPLSCPTSNCTWPEYETLAVCSECVETPDLLQYACLNTTVDWSANQTGPINATAYPREMVCGYFLNATSSAPVLMSGYIVEDADKKPSMGEALLMRTFPLTDMIDRSSYYGGSVRFKHVRNPILDALIVSATNGTDSILRKDTPVIHECVLSWCVQTIKSTYAFGVYSENITSQYLNTSAGHFPWESVPVELDGEQGTFTIYSQDIVITPPDTTRNRTNALGNHAFNKTYGMSNLTASNVIFVFDPHFPSYYTAMTPSEKPMLRYKNNLGGPTLRELAFNPLLAPNNVTHHMERLASAMTSVVRSSHESNDMLEGEAYNKESFVSVRWEWLTLPLGLLCVSFIFLAATVAKSAIEIDRLGIYKSSAYATLLYGLSDELQHKITRSGSTGTPRAKAKELKVKLQPNQGWRVSGNLFSPFTPKPKVNLPPPGWI